jgi:hypothetical protein
MEHFYNKFVKTLRDFLKDLNRYVPNDGCTQFLKCYDQLDMHKVILRYVGMMKEHEQHLKDMDECVFSEQLIVFPGINLTELWTKIPNEKKNKIFIYLHTLLVISDMMIQSISENEISQASTETNNDSEVSPLLPVSTKITSEVCNNLEFNPYIGIGGEESNLSVNEMYSGKLPDEQIQKPGLSSLASMVGIDKMLNLSELTDQLKNMKKEDIDEATNSIKCLLGDDENTTNLVSDMLTNIQAELKKEDISSGNPLDNIVKIAESVASKMQPQMDEDGIDMSKLWQSTQNLANQCSDDNGNNIFGNGMNPFDLINQMMGGMNSGNPGNHILINQMMEGMKSNNSFNPEDIMNNLPVPPGMTKEEYLNQSKNMFAKK